MKAKPMKWDWPSQRHLGKNGDCWRCCVAAVLQVPAAMVPDFLAIHKGDCDPETQRWLNARGFFVCAARSIQIPRWAGDKALIPLIAEGPTPRSQKLGQLHAVVMIGQEVVYDPHPSKAGLTAILANWLVAPLVNSVRFVP